MRKYIGVFVLLITAVLCIGGYEETSAVENNSVAITKENFPDKRIREKISKAFDKNKDMSLSEEEIKAAKKLELRESYFGENATYDLQGISKLKYVTTLIVEAGVLKNVLEITKMPQLGCLEISTTQRRASLDLRNNVNLVDLDLFLVEVKELPRSGKLRSLELESCELEKVALVDFPELRKVSLAYCDYQTLTIKNCPKLEKIIGEENNQLKKVILKNLPELTRLTMESTKKLKKLSLSKLPNLESIYIEEAKHLRTLALPRLPELRKLKIGDNAIKKLNLKKLPRLREFCIWGNKEIKVLDLRPLRKLNKLVWKRGKLKKIKFGEKKNLEYIYVSHNQLGGTWKLSKFPRLLDFECNYNKIKNIYASKHKCLQELICEHNRLRELDLYYIEPLVLRFRGNPHVTAYLYSKRATKYFKYRFDKSAKVYY